MEIAAATAVVFHSDHPPNSFRSDPHKSALLAALSHLAQNASQSTVTTNATLLNTLLKALHAAATRQGGIAPLLSDLNHAGNITEIPVQVRQAITQTLQTAAPLVNLPTDVEINTALLKLALPQSPANAVPTQAAHGPSAQSPTLVTDIKLALESLQRSLKDWTASQPASLPQPASAPTASTAAGAPPPSLPQAVSQSAQQPAPSLTALATATTPLQSSALTFNQPGTQLATGNAVQANGPDVPAPATLGPSTLIPSQAPLVAVPAKSGDIADAMASLLLLQQAATVSGTQPARQKLARPGQFPANDSAQTETALSLPAAAYRKGQGSTQHSAPTHWPQNPDANFVAKTLATRTEAALTQVRIIEASAQLQRAEASPTSPQQEPRWTFELPLATPFGHAATKFAISRDTYKTGSDAHAIIWRVHFSIDIEPLGPVQAQIALLGKNAWVSIWAEREASMKLLEAHQPLLHQTFRLENLSAEVICCLGVPSHHAPGNGKLLDSAI